MKNMNKLSLRAFRIILLFQTLTSFSSCVEKNHKVEENFRNSTENTEKVLNSVELETNKDGLTNLQTIIKTIHGNITIKFYSKQAPNTVTRFLHLVNEGFYDGLKFHRVIENFVVQTGDPTGTGKGGSGVILKSEFNSLQHIKGTVAMARSHNDIDSADSQFYIALASLPHLDGKYTIFGQVVEGLEVLDKIKQDNQILSVHILND